MAKGANNLGCLYIISNVRVTESFPSTKNHAESLSGDYGTEEHGGITYHVEAQ
jgi:hypothetical protein